MAKNPERLTTEETAQFLGIAPKTLRNKLSSRDAGMPPHYVVFGRRIWHRADLEKWLAARRVEVEQTA
jgi:hypothetical protein